MDMYVDLRVLSLVRSQDLRPLPYPTPQSNRYVAFRLGKEAGGDHCGQKADLHRIAPHRADLISLSLSLSLSCPPSRWAGRRLRHRIRVRLRVPRCPRCPPARIESLLQPTAHFSRHGVSHRMSDGAAAAGERGERSGEEMECARLIASEIGESNCIALHCTALHFHQAIARELSLVTRTALSEWCAPTLIVHGLTVADSGVLLLLFRQRKQKQQQQNKVDDWRDKLRELFPDAPKKQTKASEGGREGQAKGMREKCMYVCMCVCVIDSARM